MDCTRLHHLAQRLPPAIVSELVRLSFCLLSINPFLTQPGHHIADGLPVQGNQLANRGRSISGKRSMATNAAN